MRMIIVAGTITIPAAARAGAIEASAALQAATRNDEPGCIDYVFAADPVEPDRISVYERWESAETLEAHFLHANYRDMRVLLGSHGITGAVVSKYDIAAKAPVYNAAGIATASFE
jgi:quinol monooxygenase YgiN